MLWFQLFGRHCRRTAGCLTSCFNVSFRKEFAVRLFSFFIAVLTGFSALNAQAKPLLTAPEGQPFLCLPVVQKVESPACVSTPLANQIDQNQPNHPNNMAAFYQTCLAQSFQQTHTNISGAGISLMDGFGSSDTVTIQLWANGLPNASGTMLTEATAIGTAGQWVDVYWTPVAVTPGTTYYLVFTGNTTLGIKGDNVNPYPYGCVYANPGFVLFPNFDYTFRTYYDDAVSLEHYTWANVKASFNQEHVRE